MYFNLPSERSIPDQKVELACVLIIFCQQRFSDFFVTQQLDNNNDFQRFHSLFRTTMPNGFCHCFPILGTKVESLQGSYTCSTQKDLTREQTSLFPICICYYYVLLENIPFVNKVSIAEKALSCYPEPFLNFARSGNSAFYGIHPPLQVLRDSGTCSCHILQRQVRPRVQIIHHRYRGLHLSMLMPRAIPHARDSTTGMMKGKGNFILANGMDEDKGKSNKLFTLQVFRQTCQNLQRYHLNEVVAKTLQRLVKSLLSNQSARGMFPQQQRLQCGAICTTMYLQSL